MLFISLIKIQLFIPHRFLLIFYIIFGKKLQNVRSLVNFYLMNDYLQNDLPPTTRDIHRKERYFGESDRESASRRRHNESSAESATEVDGMGARTPSLVYLHTAAGIYVNLFQ